MKTWIFQAMPKKFDVDSFLESRPNVFTWLVTRYGSEIREGDRVYLWRAVSGEGSKAGVVAEALVASPVDTMAGDEHTTKFWQSPADAAQPAERVWLRLVRRSAAKEMLRRDWLLEDPILRNALILRQAVGTNFPLTDIEAQRLQQMWARVGQDWSRNESIAGLWAYSQTLGKSVSRLPSTPVALVSQLTGRAISGVYNKVMNFRSIDPRDSRSGMSGAGATDRVVWDEFYDVDERRLRAQDLEDEFERLWGKASAGDEPRPDARAIDAAILREAVSLAGSPLSDLMAAYERQQALIKSRAKPMARSVSSVVFDRSSLVIAIAKTRAGHRCEVPHCVYPVFSGKDGRPYCEVHHVIPLAEGGSDTIENVVCLCPAHHREVHLGERGGELGEVLRELRR